MNRRCFPIQALLLCSLLALAPRARAEDAPSSEPAPAEPAPRIHCEQRVFDFGEADNSTTVHHEFVIENQGDALLTIAEVRADCGCTVADLSSKEIEPAGRATLSANLKLQGRIGRQVKSIHLFSNDPAQPTFSVTLEGTATSLVSIEPARIEARGTAAEPLVAQTVTVKSALSHPLRITQVNAGHPHVDAELITTVPDFEYRVVLTPKDSLPGGQTQGLLRIFTESEQYPELSVPFLLLVATGDFIVAPQELVLPVSPDGKPLVRQFVVRPGRIETFKVVRVVVPDPQMESDIVKISDGYLIRLRNLVPGPDLDGSKVVVETDAEGAAPVELPLRVIRPSAPEAGL